MNKVLGLENSKNLIFDHFFQSQGHELNPPKSNQVFYGSWPTSKLKIKKIHQGILELSREQEMRDALTHGQTDGRTTPF